MWMGWWPLGYHRRAHLIPPGGGSSPGFLVGVMEAADLSVCDVMFSMLKEGTEKPPSQGFLDTAAWLLGTQSMF